MFNDIAVKGELQLECGVPCSDDSQVRDLAPIHHAVVKNKWGLGAEGFKESGRSHGQSVWCTIRARIHGG